MRSALRDLSRDSAFIDQLEDAGSSFWKAVPGCPCGYSRAIQISAMIASDDGAPALEIRSRGLACDLSRAHVAALGRWPGDSRLALGASYARAHSRSCADDGVRPSSGTTTSARRLAAAILGIRSACGCPIRCSLALGLCPPGLEGASRRSARASTGSSLHGAWPPARRSAMPLLSAGHRASLARSLERFAG
jgi:hypothetical protein